MIMALQVTSQGSDHKHELHKSGVRLSFLPVAPNSRYTKILFLFSWEPGKA